MKKNKVFITGAAGFLGSHLAEKLASMGNIVVGVDNMQGGYEDNVPKNIKFLKLLWQNFMPIQFKWKILKVSFNLIAGFLIKTLKNGHHI